ncbi:MAG TPA: carbohydrate binding family 9 domain-containing protein [Candidatus Baltobacteraceae bacterium]|nr:carbohydrate binding family 9 domain-containing protein [Candidatus Baltobacteraceae bacterium]
MARSKTPLQLACYAAACYLYFTAPCAAAAAIASSQTFTAARAPHPLAADPSLSDAAWQSGKVPQTDRFVNVTTRRPSADSTDAYLLYDDTNVYVAFVCRQSEPIVANQSANDVGFGLDDFVGIGIDTSGNGSQAYYFETTPRGVRYEQASETARYQPKWQAAARAGNGQWSAVMVIPLAAMRVHAQATQTWRFNLVRGIASAGEHYTWAFDPLMQDSPSPQWPLFSDTRYWPKLDTISFAGLRSSKRSQPEVEVYALAAAGRDRELFQQSDGSFRTQTVRNLGLDVTLPLTNTINFVATGNPDFSNVEIDQQTIAPQEFPRILREYRPFFAQGANFVTPNPAPLGGLLNPNYIFYTPAIGPFDRGEKVEGTFGMQSFGLMNFRGYDQTTGNEFDDTAFGYKHATPDLSLAYWTDGVLAHHSVAGDDSTAEAGIGIKNVRRGLTYFADAAVETGTPVASVGASHYDYGFVDWQKSWFEARAGYQDVAPDFNPLDGLFGISDVRGLYGFLYFNGASPAIKNWNLSYYADRYFDRSGKPHETDAYANLQLTFKNQFSIDAAGPFVSQLIAYDIPSGPGCSGSALGQTTFTGYPCYRNPTPQVFHLYGTGIGYRDGTPTPIDVSLNQGPYGGNFTRLYTSSTSRPIGQHLSLSLEYDATLERSLSTGVLNSQWLRRVSIGESFGPDSNFSIGLRSINGTGGFALPGVNLAASYHRKFPGGDELFFNYGTPAATATLDRFTVKYVFRSGQGAGT